MTNGASGNREGTWSVKVGLAQMLKGGVIMDVVSDIMPVYFSPKKLNLTEGIHHGKISI